MVQSQLKINVEREIFFITIWILTNLLLGHRWLLLYLLLYFCAVLPTFIKMEQTIAKSPNFQQTLLSTRTSFSRKFNDVASFVLELLGFDFYICTIFSCYFSEINKNKTNTWKKRETFSKYFSTFGLVSVKISMSALIVLELSGLVFYIYTILLCCFSEFNKNGTNNWKITKLLGNIYEHSKKPQTKFQFRSLFRFWVIRLYFLRNYYIFMLCFGI